MKTHVSKGKWCGEYTSGPGLLPNGNRATFANRWRSIWFSVGAVYDRAFFLE